MAQNGYLNNTGSFEFEERLLSTFLRGEYSYKYKYIISGILRRDGSSKFGPNNNMVFFNYLSGLGSFRRSITKYGVHQFFKVQSELRVSGNDQIANFAYRALLNGEGVYVFDDIITPGVAIGTAANPDLKWETTAQFNLGMDLRLYDKIDFTANYFMKNTRICFLTQTFLLLLVHTDLVVTLLL